MRCGVTTIEPERVRHRCLSGETTQRLRVYKHAKKAKKAKKGQSPKWGW